MDNGKKYCSGSGVPPQIPLSPIGQQRWFWIPKMGVFDCTMLKEIWYGFWNGPPNTHTSAHRGPEKVGWNIWDAGV